MVSVELIFGLFYFSLFYFYILGAFFIIPRAPVGYEIVIATYYLISNTLP